jgi:RNA polymerase sigma factor for flagellar operon FliA
MLTEQLEREPTQAELAQALGMDPAELASYQSQAQPRQVVSFDEITDNQNGDDSLSLTERLPDPNATAPDAAMLSAEDRRMVLGCLSTLPKTQATVIALHYLQNIPLRDVATVLAVTPSRVSQLHHQALARLRQAWRRHHTTP